MSHDQIEGGRCDGTVRGKLCERRHGHEGGCVVGSPAGPTPPQADTERDIVERLRSEGWSVAVHNDYRLNGEPHTFWLFTKGNVCAKGAVQVLGGQVRRGQLLRVR